MKTCYTVILGNYDKLRQPEVITPGWRYVCITDTPEICDGTVYEPVKIESVIPPNDYVAKMQKWALQTQSMIFRKDKIVYHDGSFQVIGNLDEYIKPFENAAFATRLHPSRKHWMQEATECFRLKKISSNEAAYFVDMPTKIEGLWENGLLYFSHQNDSGKWEEKIDKLMRKLSITTRDQILLPIVLENELEPALIDREHAKHYFKWYPHN